MTETSELFEMTDGPVSTAAPRRFVPMPQSAFLALGMHEIAYVRAQQDGNRTTWIVHRADGTPVLASGALGQATGEIIRNDLLPMLVH